MELSATLMKMWIITEKDNGNDFDIKKIADSNQEIIEYNAETSKITIKNGEQIPVFKTFKEAAIITIGKKITKKKELWDAKILESYKINEDIGKLIDSLDKLRKVTEES
jgi:hypothetical protein